LRHDLAVLQSCSEIGAHGFLIGVGLYPHERVRGLVAGGVEQHSRLLQRGEDIGERSERADAVRDGADLHPRIVDLRRLTVLLDAEVGEVGVVDGDGERRIEIGEATLHDVPRLERSVLVIGADEENRRGAALGLAPSSEADDELLGIGDARRGKYCILLVPDEQRGIVEALGAQRHDPKVALRFIEHGGDHTLRPDVQSALDGNEHHREDDAGERNHEAQLIMKEIPVSELRRHLDGLRLASRCNCRAQRHSVDFRLHWWSPSPGQILAGVCGLLQY
jgi:hypothetical protein